MVVRGGGRGSNGRDLAGGLVELSTPPRFYSWLRATGGARCYLLLAAYFYFEEQVHQY